MTRILFLHPDLGIGGAERLVVDAALALKQKGHKLSFLTNHHDPEHCFEETRDGTFPVEIVGDWLPRHIIGRFYAFCAYLRMIYAAFYTTFYLSRQEQIDIIFCDQISLGIPILKLAKGQPKIIFYCHFPDQLLSSKGGLLKQLYRLPLNFLEEITTGQANRVLVNSKFTRRIFHNTFKRLNTTPDVLYPSLNTKFFDETIVNEDDVSIKLPEDNFIFLSLNRFERKKNLPLALKAFQYLELSLSQKEWERCHLIIAGGYDKRVIENVEHFLELQNLAEKLNLVHKITFLRSPTDKQKIFILKRSHCLLYTPANEHFGIVPLEAMYMHKPVVAVNSGGPMETIVHDSTGFLCEQSGEEFSKSMLKLLRDVRLIERMGEMGRKRVQQRFAFDAFADKLDCIITELMNKKIE